MSRIEILLDGEPFLDVEAEAFEMVHHHPDDAHTVLPWDYTWHLKATR